MCAKPQQNVIKVKREKSQCKLTSEVSGNKIYTHKNLKRAIINIFKGKEIIFWSKNVGICIKNTVKSRHSEIIK